MKINLISDLHLDFYDVKKACNILNETIIDIDCDLHIIAGDLTSISHKNTSKIIKYLDNNVKSKVLYVFGNHELYHSKPMDAFNKVRDMDLDHISLIENTCVEVDNTLIYGGTMWFNESVESIENTKIYPQIYALNDFNYINVTKDYYTLQNKTFFNNINANVDIVISHHIPIKRMLRYTDAEDEYDMNKFYWCKEAQQYLNIETHKIKLWACGHTHDCADILYNDTRIVNNPYGYPFENNYMGSKIIEI